MSRRHLPRLSRRQDVSALTEDVSVGDRVEEGQRGAVDAVERVSRVHRLEQVAHVAHVDAGLAHRVRLLHHLHRADDTWR